MQLRAIGSKTSMNAGLQLTAYSLCKTVKSFLMIIPKIPEFALILTFF